jgi:hypothetical protein
MDKRAVHKIVWSVILTAIILLIMNGENWYWRYWPHNPITLYSLKICPETKKVYPGGFVYYTLDFDKKSTIIPILYRQLINSFVYTLTSTTPTEKALGRQKTTATIPIPRMAEYGEYQIRWTASYEVGPEKRVINRSILSDAFLVVPNPKEVKGEKGDTGDTGKRGIKGDKGDRGRGMEFNIFGK